MISFLMVNRGFEEKKELRESLIDLALGRGVKRGRHTLESDGRDYSEEFKRVLVENGFVPTTVKNIDVSPGERVPAFYIKDKTAYFGWIFYEKFTEKKLRKLWGSVVRNKKGDWAIQISPKKEEVVYVKPEEKVEMDLDRPTDW